MLPFLNHNGLDKLLKDSLISAISISFRSNVVLFSLKDRCYTSQEAIIDMDIFDLVYRLRAMKILIRKSIFSYKFAPENLFIYDYKFNREILLNFYDLITIFDDDFRKKLKNIISKEYKL